MSRQVSAFFGRGLLSLWRRSAGEFFAVVSLKLARFVDELLALGFAFVSGFLLRHEIAFPSWAEPS